MKRGDVWTAAGASGYAGKHRPVLILQDDAFSGTDSVIVGLFTTDKERMGRPYPSSRSTLAAASSARS